MEVTEIMNTSIELNQLESKVDTLIGMLEKLQSENKALHARVHKVMQERDTVLMQKQHAISQVKELISQVNALISKEKECVL